jgi:hypothetical protein
VARACSVCVHPDRHAIDKALVAGESCASVAAIHRVSSDSMVRHQANHVPKLLAQARESRDNAAWRAEELQGQAERQETTERAHAVDVMEELERCFHRVNLLFDACDRWLRDADDPTRYDLGPRASDVVVTYLDRYADGSLRPRKAPLSQLLARLDSALTPDGRPLKAEIVEIKHADPRELVLRTAAQLKGQTELLAKLLGELDERPQVNVLVMPEWLTLRTRLLAALLPYPEARLALSEALDAG